MKIEPKHWPRSLAECRKCGARARNRGGAPCRAPAVGGKKRCRLHGGARGSGGQLGAKNGAWRGGKYSKEGKALVQGLMKMARAGEALLAGTLDAAGLPRKVPKAIRRKAHVRRARAEFKKAKAAREETK
jgi:hypothetical protein